MDALELSDRIENHEIKFGDKVILSSEFGEHEGKVFEIIGFRLSGLSDYWRPIILCEFGNLITEDKLRHWENNSNYRVRADADKLEGSKYWVANYAEIRGIVSKLGSSGKDDGDRLLEFFSADVRRNEHGPSGLLFP